MVKGLLVDRRHDPRVRVSLELKFKIFDKPELVQFRRLEEKVIQAGRAESLSVEGLALFTRTAVKAEQGLELVFDLPEAREPLKAFAKVAWCQYNRSEGIYEVGLKFLEINKLDASFLAKYMVEKLEDLMKPLLRYWPV